MKNIDKFIPRLKQCYGVSAYYDKNTGINDIPGIKAKKSIFGNACLLLPNSYWSVERTFKAAHVFDLIRLAKLERERVSPFPAVVLWQVVKLEAKEMQVKYFCVPLELVNELASKFQLLVPIEAETTHNDVATELLGNSAQASQLNIDEILAKSLDLPVWKVAGYRLNQAESAREPIIPVRAAAIIGVSVTALYVIGLSGYLVSKLSNIESKLDSQKAQVNEALLVQQKAQSYQDVLASSKAFFSDNPTVAKVINSIKLEDVKYRLTRIEVENNRLSMFGFAFNATDVLKKVSESEYVINAKFRLPVEKNGRFESFIIEGELSDD